MRFDLTDLQLFVHILDCGTLTAAAGRSHMTLASASERVRGMEEQLGCALLARQARGVRPTAAGHTLGQHARDVLARMQRLRGDMAEYGAGLAGHVRLCGNTSAVSEHLPLPRGHRLARRARLALQDLLAEDWVGLPHDAALQVLVRQQAALLGGTSGGQLRWRAQLQHLDSICQLVGQDVGVAVMPEAAAKRLAPACGARAVPLADAWAQRRLLLCTAEPERLPAHAGLLLEHLKGLAMA
jgi:DNA-binding transcriptional LysR family regulator